MSPQTAVQPSHAAIGVVTAGRGSDSECDPSTSYVDTVQHVNLIVYVIDNDMDGQLRQQCRDCVASAERHILELH